MTQGWVTRDRPREEQEQSKIEQARREGFDDGYLAGKTFAGMEIATLRARVAELEGRDRSAVALLRKWKYGWTFGRYVPVEESQAFINAAPIPMPGAEG